MRWIISTVQLVETCSCGAPVLTVVGLGSTWLVDAIEVFPEGPCPRCHGKGYLVTRRHRVGTYHLANDKADPGYVSASGPVVSVPCVVCRGTGVRGEPVERGMILVDHMGFARRYFGQDRMPGEAFHRAHACALANSEPEKLAGDPAEPTSVAA